MTIERASDNPFPSILMVEGDPEDLAANPAVGQQRLAVDDTDHLLYLVDDAGVKTAVGGGLSDPMTTRGDVIIRNASNVSDRLAIGSAGKVLSSDGTDISWQTGGLPAGTSFPGSPSDGDLYFRTDRDVLYRYHSTGTRWLSTDLLTLHFGQAGSATTALTATGTVGVAGIPYKGVYDLWLERMDFEVQLAGGTSNGSNYWNLKLNYYDSAGSRTLIATVADTKTAVVSQNTVRGAAIGSVLSSSAQAVEAQMEKVSAPANIYPMAPQLLYRLVG